jgi:hypothetical protein
VDDRNSIDASEKQDFEDALERYGNSIEEFELHAVEDPLPPTGLGFVRGTITVSHKATGATRRYRYGHATAWVVDFERDLQAGAFR